MYDVSFSGKWVFLSRIDVCEKILKIYSRVINYLPFIAILRMWYAVTFDLTYSHKCVKKSYLARVFIYFLVIVYGP